MEKHKERIKPRKMSRKKKRRILLGTAGILLLGAFSYSMFVLGRGEEEQWIYKESKVTRGTLTVGVSESGALDFGLTQVIYDLDLTVSEESDGTTETDEEEETIQKYVTIDTIGVVPGQRISAGDTLLQFTADSVSDVKKLLTNAVLEAQSAYQSAKADYDLSMLSAKTQFDIQKVESTYAKTLYNSGTSAIKDEIASMQIQVQERTVQIPDLEEDIQEAKEAYSEAQEDYDDTKDLLNLYGDSRHEQYLAAQTGYLNMQSRMQSAKDALERANQALIDNATQLTTLNEQITAAKASEKLDLLKAEQTYQESVTKGENAQITYDAEAESLKEDLDEAQEAVTAAEEQLSAFLDFVGADGTIYAEGDGIVTEVNYEAGDTIRQTGTILSYAQPGDMTITVDVTQEDVVSLTVGDKVEIIFQAYPEEIYTGSILSIDTTATTQDSATVSYAAVIGVEGDTVKLYGGMTADITFVTDKLEDVLYIPQSAVVKENGKTYVYTGSGSEKQLQEIEVGEGNGIYTEVLSGLSQEDTIYIASRISSEAAVESTTEGDGNGTNDEGMGNDDIGADFEQGFPGGDFPGGDFSGFDEEGMNGWSGDMPGDMPQNMPQGGAMPQGGGMPDWGGMP